MVSSWKNSSSSSAPASEPMVIAGAGLVGALLAVFLGRRGQVEVIERRADPRQSGGGEGRSINLAVSARGLHALARVGLRETILERAIAMRGRMIHQSDGHLDFQPYGKTGQECIHSLSRSELNKILISAAEASGRVRFKFDSAVTAIDATRREVIIRTTGGEETRLRASRVFGTDGAASVVRQQVLAATGGRQSLDQLSHGYKELLMPARADGGFAMEKHALHIWPRGAYMLIALPNFDGSYTCTLFLPMTGPLSFAELSTPEQVTKLFKAQFPDAMALIPDLIDQYFTRPTGAMTTVRCDTWHHQGQTVLLGDAAHAIVPFFGQGMNCGFEDCTLLDDLIAALPKEASDADWQTAYERFSAERRPNANAIADMALENFVEMRDLVADRRFLLRKACEKRLEQEFGERFVSRYSLVSFSLVPYSQAYQSGVIQGQILDELCRNLDDPRQLDLGAARRLLDSATGTAMEFENRL